MPKVDFLSNLSFHLEWKSMELVLLNLNTRWVIKLLLLILFVKSGNPMLLDQK